MRDNNRAECLCISLVKRSTFPLDAPNGVKNRHGTYRYNGISDLKTRIATLERAGTDEAAQVEPAIFLIQ